MSVYPGEEGAKLRIGRFATAVLAGIVLVGCSGGEKSGSTAEKDGKSGGKTLTVGIVFDSGGRGDKSFNDSAYAGMQKAEKELGIKINSVDSKREKDYESNITSLAEQGCDVIFAVGLSQNIALSTVAPKFKDTKFAIVDAVVDKPNVRSLVFCEEQGSFLAGYAAALVSKTNKIGFVGGKKIDLITKFEDGYIAGAKTAKPTIEVLPAKYTDSWDDTSLGKASAETLYSQGADVVYHAAGRCGVGVIDAARARNGVFAIGVDSDQDHLAQGKVLTSMIKRVDVAVFETIKDVKDGKFTAGTKQYDIKVDGVGLSPFTYTKDVIGAENLKKIDEVKKQIIDGKIVVPAKPDDLTKYLATLKK